VPLPVLFLNTEDKIFYISLPILTVGLDEVYGKFFIIASAPDRMDLLSSEGLDIIIL